MQQQQNQNQDLLTVEELAEALKVPKSWVYAQTRQARATGFPFLKAGKYLRFRFDAVERWMREDR